MSALDDPSIPRHYQIDIDRDLLPKVKEVFMDVSNKLMFGLPESPQEELILSFPNSPLSITLTDDAKIGMGYGKSYFFTFPTASQTPLFSGTTPGIIVVRVIMIPDARPPPVLDLLRPCKPVRKAFKLDEGAQSYSY
ncbi:hypothetical protein SERLADRAFT_432041 [Serpula lacrymans var. lacrymans S7.9]|uniref:Uncharacterized protein n=1 Tax=Serpula lacrymans var. lacrymans (strain S7.9) TaxID=578457 RepID=F8NE98_SERL9|nr:uncharacterized protein SERLADRAFT_432041 [Serpula lacrymans var. lacrymans S7.9]EGO30480.1 hypothetical protein SERLADRAFT_432041 [Serpula lacrymans var. lacrymans S7.9]